MDNSKPFQSTATIIGGFALSFVGLGILWAGAPWPYQFLMFFPFLLLTFIAGRAGGSPLSVLLGALPIAALLVQFRDQDDSHLMPVLTVCAWVGGAFLGHYLGVRLKKPKAESDNL